MEEVIIMTIMMIIMMLFKIVSKLQNVNPRLIRDLKIILRFMELTIEREKGTYIIAKLAEEYHVSERTICRTIRMYKKALWF